MQTFEVRFEELHRVAYRTAYPLLGDRQQSQDIAQDTLMRAYRDWTAVESYAAAWVSRVALNLTLDHLKRRRRPAEPLQAVSDTERAAERIDLERALRSLPERQREVVVLRYLVDRPEREVAALLGISVGSVKTHSSRGLTALRTCLSEDVIGRL